jgi:hypothetical protein
VPPMTELCPYSQVGDTYLQMGGWVKPSEHYARPFPVFRALRGAPPPSAGSNRQGTPSALRFRLETCPKGTPTLMGLPTTLSRAKWQLR